MNQLAMVAVFLVLSSTAYGYQERIERDGDQVRGAWFSQAMDATPGTLSERVPGAGNFYAFDGTFVSKDLSCDDFIAKVHQLISDWNNYHTLNMYALTVCTVPPGTKSRTEFIYGIDAWVPQAVAEDAAFLKAHQGIQFQDQTLEFSEVTSLDVKSDFELDVLKGNALTSLHDASFMSSYSGTDTWWSDYDARAQLVQQTNETKYLDYIGEKISSSEADAFRGTLSKSNFVDFSDFFTLHLSNGQLADFWLGFGSSRSCGTKACFAD